jgi:hypothetical protein
MTTRGINLTPSTDPPSRSARWCPSCCVWWLAIHARGRRRCPVCRAALVRQMPMPKPRPGELRPGIIAQFNDPRDHDVAAATLATVRAQLQEQRPIR